MAAPERKTWRQAALGGLLVALGGALFGFGRSGAAASSATTRGQPSAKQRTKERAKERSGARRQERTGAGSAGGAKPRGRAPEAAPLRTRHWPPPAPKPIGAAEPEERPAPRPVDATSVALGYERRDAKSGTVVLVMLSGAAAIVVAVAGLFALIHLVHGRDRQGPALTEQQLAVIVPPGPRLQDHPLHDIAVERQRESDLLRFYAWTDARHTAARIPIARAEALVLGRSLDPLPAPAPEPRP